MAFKIEQLDGTHNIWSIEIKNTTDSYVYLGKDMSCHIQVAAPDIEPRHCRFEINEGKLLIKDMRSNSGTFVNGAQILEAQLHDGDILSIGYIELVVHDMNLKKIHFPLTSQSPAWNEQLRSL
jgi:pSer/pThr/pTyr-binding forkhead associated (FHA) protein